VPGLSEPVDEAKASGPSRRGCLAGGVALLALPAGGASAAPLPEPLPLPAKPGPAFRVVYLQK
jgi:hypothetical protein